MIDYYMLPICLLSGLGVSLCAIAVLEGKDWLWMVGIAVLMFIGAGITTYYMLNTSVDQGKRKIELHSINSNDNISGYFSLGSGSINQRKVYQFYYKADGAILYDYKFARNSKIIEEDITDAYLILPVIVTREFGKVIDIEDDRDLLCEFHVPFKSVIKDIDFKLN